MIISAVRVLELNEKYNLIEGLAKRELENPEGTVLDLRVGRVERLVGDSFLGVDEPDGKGGKRHSSKTELIGDVKVDGNKLITMKPGDYYLVQTMESVNAPAVKIKYDEFFPEAYLKPEPMARSSLQRGGLALLFTGVNPGWEGQLTFGLKNLGNQDFSFQLGARLFSVEYHAVSGDIKRPYTGQHQGGRVTSQGVSEVQT